MPAAAAIVAVSAITTGLQLSEAAKARKDAKEQAAEQQKKQAALDQQLKDKQTVTALTESFKQRKRPAGTTQDTYNKGGTLLTSPLGTGGGAPPAGGKTLLGA